MTNIFFNILGMNLTASYCIILVCIIRLFLRKTPKIYSYCLWSVVLFRLICPVSLASPISLVSADILAFSEKLSDRGIQQASEDLLYDFYDDTTYLINVDDDISYYGTDSGTVDSYRSTEKNTTYTPSESSIHNIMPDDLTDILKSLWLLGMTVIFIYSISSYIHLRIKLHKNSEYMMKYRGITVYKVRGLSTPFVMGIINPSIYLLNNLDDSQREVCLAHEYTHIKRYDHLIKMLAFIVICIHWFNPLVWLFFKLMTSDMEMSCDEMALRNAGIDERKTYSKVLLSLAEDRNYIFAGCPLAFAEDNSKARIKNILNYKKPAVWAASICVITVIICVIGLSVDPSTEETGLQKAVNISDNTTDQINPANLADEEKAVKDIISDISSIKKNIVSTASMHDDIIEGLKLMEEEIVDDSEELLIKMDRANEKAYLELKKQMLEEELLVLEQELSDMEAMLDGYDSYLETHYIYSGTYIMEITDNNNNDNPSNNMSKPRMTIHTYDQSFSVESGDLLSSFYPHGTYSISDDKLICTTDDYDYKYVFGIIDKDRLQFIEDESYIPERIDKEHSLEITDDAVFIKSP